MWIESSWLYKRLSSRKWASKGVCVINSETGKCIYKRVVIKRLEYTSRCVFQSAWTRWSWRDDWLLWVDLSGIRQTARSGPHLLLFTFQAQSVAHVTVSENLLWSFYGYCISSFYEAHRKDRCHVFLTAMRWAYLYLEGLWGDNKVHLQRHSSSITSVHLEIVFLDVALHRLVIVTNVIDYSTPEDGGSKHPRNVGNYLPIDTTLYDVILEFSWTLSGQC
jgi:hypothetical protein